MATCEPPVMERRTSRSGVSNNPTTTTTTSGMLLERQHISMLVMIMVGAVIFSAAKSMWQLISPGYRPLPELSDWLHDNRLSSYGAQFADMGLVTLVDYAQLEGVRLSALPARDRERLQRAARILRQQLLLRQWLHEHNLTHHARRLSQMGISSLEDVYWLEDARAESALGKDLGQWSSARQSLPTSKSDLEGLKAQLWIRLQQHNDQLKSPWTWGGMLVVSVSMAGLVALATMTQPVLTPETKSNLLRYVTGKYLLPNNCQVRFDWQEPQVVGDTMTFTVKFFQRNGRPYPICDRDNFLVEITQGCHKVAVATELGAADPAMANAAILKFTVRRAGQYRISVLVANQHIKGSPFLKNFLPGPPDPNKTVLVRHNSTVVCTAGVSHSLQIEPRDEFNNMCCGTRSESEDEEMEPTGGGSDANPLEGYELSIWNMGNNNGVEDEPALKLPGCPTTLLYHPDSQRLSMVLKMEREGCYRARLTYKGTTLSNGDFDIIVLSGAEAALVQRNTETKSHNIYHEARLVAIQGERLAKPKKVYVYISPKQLTIKEYLFKLIPKRLLTFRLCPSTKFSFPNGQNGASSAGPGVPQSASTSSLVVDDGCQPKVELATPDRNVIAATFTHFLLKNIGGSETFKDKQDFFYHEVRKHHQKHYHDKFPIEIQRECLLDSSMKATKRFSVADWCKNMEITFLGEQGLDWGGLRREWFELTCASLFDPSCGGLFTSFVESKQALVHPNARRPQTVKLKHYEFAGKMVGKCLYESALGGTYRQLVRARFTRSFLAQLIGLRVHYKYFEQDDPDLYLTKVKYILEHDVDDMDLFFVEEEYDRCGRLLKVVELIPGGAKTRVTNQSKYQYLDALAQYRLANCVREEVEAFLKGLNEIIPDNLLSIFDENELELLMCGTGEYSISDLKAHHVASGSSYEFRKVLDWFWTAVSNFTEEEMARLLQFTTGCSQLPPGGFSQLSPKFQLTAAPTFANLPTAHTCFNQLCLPDYESYEQFEKALLLAINEGTEGFGLV